MKKKIINIFILFIMIFIMIFIMPITLAKWTLHSKYHTVKINETLTIIAMKYVNKNTPLKVYRESLYELNYELLSKRDDHDVREGDVILINYWIDE